MFAREEIKPNIVLNNAKSLAREFKMVEQEYVSVNGGSQGS